MTLLLLKLQTFQLSVLVAETHKFSASDLGLPHPTRDDGFTSYATLNVEPGVEPDGATNPVIVTVAGVVQNGEAGRDVEGITSCTGVITLLSVAFTTPDVFVKLMPAGPVLFVKLAVGNAELPFTSTLLPPAGPEGPEGPVAPLGPEGPLGPLGPVAPVAP